MADYLLDTFAGTAASPLSGHTPNTGGEWGYPASPSSDSVLQLMAGGGCRPFGAGGPAANYPAVNAATPSGPDVTAVCTVGVTASVPAGSLIRFIIKFVDSNNYLFVQVEPSGAAAVYQEVGGSYYPSLLAGGNTASPLPTGLTDVTAAVSGRTMSVTVADLTLNATGIDPVFDGNLPFGFVFQGAGGWADDNAFYVSKVHAYTGTPTPPLTAGTLAAGTPTASTVPLTYATVTAGTAPYASQFEISGHGLNIWTNTGSPAAGATPSYAATGLAPSTQYDFRVVTTDAATPQGSVTSNVVTATTAAGSSGGGADIAAIRTELDARGLTTGLAAAMAALVLLDPTKKLKTVTGGYVQLDLAQPTSSVPNPADTTTVGGLLFGYWCPTLTASADAFASAILADPSHKVATDSGGGVTITSTQISVLGTQLPTGTVVSATQQSVTVAPTGGTVFPATANLYTGPDAPRFLHFLGTGPLGGEVVEISGYTPPSGSGVNATFAIKSAMRAVPGTGVAVQVE